MKQYIFLLKIRISQWLILIFLISSTSIRGQTNLVKNSSFEDYLNCPDFNLNNAGLPFNWYNAGKFITDSYINACSNSVCNSVPQNCCSGSIGYQNTNTGNGMVATIFMNLGIGSNRRNSYIATKLIDSLKKDNCYQIIFFVNACNNVKYACNNISALLSKTQPYVDTLVTPYGVLPANAQIYNYGNPIITDTLNWVKVSSVYVAQGGEQFLTLGNFKYDNQTNFKIINPNGYNGSSYYIDDVSVIPLDSMPLQADAGRDTTIKVGDSIFIGSLTNGLTNVKWYDSNNNEILNKAGVPGFYVTPSNTTFYVIEQMVCGNYSKDTIHIIVNPLPLKFISYSLSLRGVARNEAKQSVTSEWTTANEINVSHYNITKSIDGKIFKTIGKVKANNKSYNEYQFEDLLTTNYLLPTTLYYRIIGVDNDGKLSYSEIRNVELGIRNGISIFPNPAKDMVHIECKQGIKEVKLFDIYSKEVASLPRNNANINHLSLTINHYPKGLYIVQVINNKGKVLNEKLVIE